MPAPVPDAVRPTFLPRALFFLVRGAALLVLFAWTLCRVLAVPMLALVAGAAAVVCWTAKGLR